MPKRKTKPEAERTFDDWYSRVCEFYDSYDAGGEDRTMTLAEFCELLRTQTPQG